MKKYESIRQQRMDIILKKEKMMPLTKKHQKLHEKPEICFICNEKFIQKYTKEKKIIKSGIINIKQLDAEELHIEYVI